MRNVYVINNNLTQFLNSPESRKYKNTTVISNYHFIVVFFSEKSQIIEQNLYKYQ